MESTGETEIWASDFDAGSDDECSHPVKVSFSPDVTDLNRTFTCDDLGRQVIEVWVTDIAGNQDFCSTTIIIQDNSNVCNGLQGDISGLLRTEDGRLLEGAEILLMKDSDGVFRDVFRRGWFVPF